MPLFFVISGYFYKERKLKNFIFLKYKSLILPYIYTCLAIISLSGILSIVKNLFFSKDIKIWLTMREWLLASLYGSGSNELLGIRAIGAIWFLLALFWSLCFLNILLKHKHKSLVVIILFFIGYFTKNIIWLPLSIQSGLCALSYVYIGWILNKYNLMTKLIDARIFIISIIIWLSGIYFGCGKLYLVVNYFGLTYFDFVVSIFAVISVFNIAYYIMKVKYISNFLKYLGVNSLKILCFHIIELNLFPWYAIIKGIYAQKVIFISKIIFNVICVGIFNFVKNRIK